MILNKSQAEAVYTAMCALNDVNGVVSVDFHEGGRRYKKVFPYLGHGNIRVCIVDNFDLTEWEDYASQDAFYAAYSLES